MSRCLGFVLSRPASALALALGLGGMATPSLAQYLYPTFTHNVNIQWAGIRLDQPAVPIPAGRYHRYAVTIDYLTKPHQNGNHCGIEFAFADQPTPFPPFFFGTVFGQRSWDGTTCVPPGPDYTATIRRRGEFTTPFTSPGQIWWYVREMGGIGATYRQVAIHLLPAVPANDHPTSPVDLGFAPAVIAVQPALAEPNAEESAVETGRGNATPYSLWYTVTAAQSGPHYFVMRQTGFAQPTGAAVSVFEAVPPDRTSSVPRVGEQILRSNTGVRCGAGAVAELQAGQTYFIAVAEALGPDLRELARYDLHVSTAQPPSAGCNPADIVSTGGEPCPDQVLTGDDFVAFINAFAVSSLDADITGTGGSGLPDGKVTGDDLILFINALAAGCS